MGKINYITDQCLESRLRSKKQDRQKPAAKIASKSTAAAALAADVQQQGRKRTAAATGAAAADAATSSSSSRTSFQQPQHKWILSISISSFIDGAPYFYIHYFISD